MLGQKIQEHRVAKQMTQAQLGALLGVQQTTVAMYETGKITPSHRRLEKLIAVLSMDARDLFASEQSGHPAEQAV